MAKQRHDQSPANFIREQGWENIVLYGAPIMNAGAQIERSVTLIVTAVGRDAVLGQGASSGEGYRREGMWTFDSREWFVNGEQERGISSTGADRGE